LSLPAAVSLVFFLSGAAALIFETLWFRQAGLVFGNSVWAASVVLASFMGGLALGNTVAARYGPRLRRPLRVYALLELLIGATGLALVLLLPSLTVVTLPVLRPFTERPAVLNAVRLSLSFALLLVPSTAMGATLPLLVKALAAREPNFGRLLGRLYGWNTLGAAAGALAGEFALMAVLGLRLTGVVAALLDIAAAVVATSLSRRTAAAPDETFPAAAAPLGGRAVRLMGAAFLCGAILLALEVVWFRFLLMFLSGTSAGFAAMLSVVLIGIGAGGLAASRWTARDAAAHQWLPVVALLAGVAVISTYVTFDRVLALQDADYSHTPRAIFQESCGLMLIACFTSGLLFTLIGRALRDGVQDATRAAGLLTLANTTGAMLGGPLAGFVLLPRLGMERSLFALATAYGMVAVATAGTGSAPAGRSRGERTLRWAAAAVFALFVALFPFGLMTKRYLGRVVQRFASDGSHPIALQEGLTETVLVMRRDTLGEPVSYRLVTNGFSMSGTGMLSDRYMKLFVYWPVAVHPHVERALLISYGAGTTARALADTSGLRSIDVVDISREILGMARVIFAPPRRSPLLDPRVRVHVEDGRFFLASTRDRFDLITAEPPPPGHAGIVNLYSREYFRLVHDRLSEGGVATHWLPVFSMEPGSARSVIRAFCDVFEDCSMWAGAGLNWMLAGSRGGLAPVGEEAFARQWRDPSLLPRLQEEGLESPEIVGTTFIGDAPWLRELTRGSAPVVDDRPHRIGPDVADPRPFLPYYRSLVDTDAARARFGASDAIRRLWPAGLRARTLESFDFERALDGYVNSADGGRIPRLEALLTALLRTSSRTLPLWLMDVEEADVRIAARAARAGRTDPDVQLLLALEAMARRDYRASADALLRLGSVHPSTPRAAIVTALALRLAGDIPAAGAETESACAGSPPVLDGETCGWLRGLSRRALLSGEAPP